MNIETHPFTANRNQGFTLLELLIAMVLTTLISVLAYGGLRVTISGWEQIETRSAAQTDLYLTQRFLRRILRTELSNELINIYDENASVPFFGMDNELIFLASTTLTPDEARQWLYLSANEHAGLLIATTPYNELEAIDFNSLLETLRNPSLSRHSVLTKGDISRVEFSFLKISANGDQDWKSEWLFLTKLPDAIRIHFEPIKEESNNWPDLLVLPDENNYEFKRIR
ncbi:MAG: prepilin-type N-terminal cleavage/methylation domain-containing protein [Oceanospirillales bacterium]|nr:prepilin-type N-terminal cleavage/methylation domain-containing protein [Oceanospirillales bacterium]MBR9888926.1 prepilin-type N-terminal cleavage/methylation domain-containing protein [Oceanospirillales bacterium]